MNKEDVVRFVGATGLPGSGKGEFIRLAAEFIEGQGMAHRYYSHSEELRAEAKRRNLSVERPVLRSIANELRLKFGGGALSTMLVRKILLDLEEVPESSRVVVFIDAIRNPGEVETLRRELAPRFVLVAVEAPLEVLVERISSRARFDEKEEIVRQKEAARQMILGESGQGEPSHGHNIARCMEMADYRVDNSADLDALKEAARRFAEEWLL